MQFFKVCPADENVDDPAAWGLAWAETYRDAAIEHFRYIERHTHAGFHQRDMIVTHERGGVAKCFRVSVEQVLKYAADELIEVANG